MSGLLESLKKYSENGCYPMHMPGHKRNLLLLPDYGIDITEIEGFDDLHSPKGILKESIDYAASVYGSKETFFSVNGSTCALQAAIFAVTRRGDKILMERGCHKSVYNAVTLRGLLPYYIYEDSEMLSGDAADSFFEKIESLLISEKIKILVITSPEYDGTVKDIKKYAEICHRHEAVLVVDEAHGAHLPFAAKAGLEVFFTRSAIYQDADIVVQSLHKTLPAMTQTALLHRMSDRVSGERIADALAVFETSSPSYVLMASIDSCVHFMQENADGLFKEYADRLKAFYKTARKEFPELFDGKRLGEICEGSPHFDPGKILICGKNLSMTGKEIYDILIRNFGIMPELSAGDYCLCMTSVCDSEEGFLRLAGALKEIRSRRIKEAGDCKTSSAKIYKILKTSRFCIPAKADELARTKVSLKDLRAGLEGRAFFEQALQCDSDGTAFTGSGEKPYVAAETVTVYPPGIPVLVQGEYITGEIVDCIIKAIEYGSEVYGVHDGGIYVLAEV